MWHSQKGYLKDVPISGGFLTIIATFDPLNMSREERKLVYHLVDYVEAFTRRKKEKKDGEEGENRIR